MTWMNAKAVMKLLTLHVNNFKTHIHTKQTTPQTKQKRTVKPGLHESLFYFIIW